MKECTIYPAMYKAGNCLLCPLFAQCEFKDIPKFVSFTCGKCGYTIEIKEEFATDLKCPVCGQKG